MDVLDRPYEAGDKIIRVSFTIGAAIYPDDISEFDKLLSSVEIVRNSVHQEVINLHVFSLIPT
jgi:hypothetical protein